MIYLLLNKTMFGWQIGIVVRSSSYLVLLLKNATLLSKSISPMPRHRTDDFWLVVQSDSDTVFGADDGQLLKAHRIKGEHLTFAKVRCSPL